jgi:SnoaL-like polyketide cyclase
MASRNLLPAGGLAAILFLQGACSTDDLASGNPDMMEFAMRYTTAWCSQDPAEVASFFAEKGSLKINDGEPSVGRAAITEVARSFMTAFPDMVVEMDRLERAGTQYRYHWTLKGTNTGPGGTGRRVRISGYEDWTIGPDGLIAASLGHFDAADYARQLGQ